MALDEGLGGGFQVSAYILADPTPPSVHVFPSEGQFHRAMQDGLEFLQFTVRALVSLDSDIGGQQNLLAIMGTNSGGVKAALEADKTLGGVCDRLQVAGWGNYQPYVKADGTQLIGADWTVDVYL